MDDLISRQAAIDYCYALINAENPSDPSDEWNYSQERINQTEVILHHLEFMPSAQPEIIYCRDCKYFELDHFEKVDEFPIPIIVAHEICMKWSCGCRTSIDGWCFMAKRRTNETDY